MRKKLNILILSARKINHSGNLAGDLITALENAGHNVTFGFPGIDGIIDKLTEKKSFFRRVIQKVSNYIPLIKKYFILSNSYFFDGYTAFIKDELYPGVNPKTITSKLTGNYDIVYFLFFADMMSMATVKAVYEKLQCPIIVSCVDMYPMTGGCYYFGDCRGFKNECRQCPMYPNEGDNNQSHNNFLFKKKLFDNDNLFIICNSWIESFARQTNLFKEQQIVFNSFYLNETKYAPQKIDECRKYFHIPTTKDFVLLARYRNIKRKGFEYIESSINSFFSDLSSEKKAKCLLLLIGEVDNTLQSRFPIDVMQLGFLNNDELIKAYNAASVFLCSSTDDAGPSMINQSMACGTPVIAFNCGTSLDVLQTGISGYNVEFKNIEDYINGVKYIYELSDDDYKQLRVTTRQTALKYNSLKVISDTFERIYETSCHHSYIQCHAVGGAVFQ